MNPSIIHSFKEQFLNIKSLTLVLAVAILYFSFSVLSLNYRLVLATIFNPNPFVYKIKVIYELIKGSYSAFYIFDFYELILISFLVGLNFIITGKIIKNLRQQDGKISLVFGGSTVLGLLAVGCSSCGFSILSVLGIASALSIIPLYQFGLSFIAILLLILSFIYSMKIYHNKVVCKIQR